MTTLSFSKTAKQYSPCWLPCPEDDIWLKRYLRAVYLTEANTLLRATLCAEIKALNENVIFLEAAGGTDASLTFLLSDSPSQKREHYTINVDENKICISANDWPGLLYGWFHLLRYRESPAQFPLLINQKPAFTIRMINHWDNMDGTIERGYAGCSLFFCDNQISYDTERLQQYARLLASIGINAIAINNVNVHHQETALIDESLLPAVSHIAAIFRQYAIRLFLSINFAAPVETGELDTADPLDDSVINWWQAAAKRVYNHIPDFGGYIVKADSEHRPGPFTYQRTHADGANMLARTLAPWDGLVYWRCFVYNCQQKWYDRTTDRAKAAWEHFSPLDGQFDDNVILQVKSGPMDFQVREPVSPLLGGMVNTNKVMELQITQEYTGQQIDLCWLVPQWKNILNFDTRPGEHNALISDILAGDSHHNMQHTGVTAVVNTGDSRWWTGHPLAQANLYGYGRLLWDPQMEERALAEEWCQLSLSMDHQVVEAVSQMLLSSWQTYENYTSPLGIGWMVQPHHHYGPAVDGYEYSSWGTYHYADRYGLGVDRTLARGTGYVKQYHPLNCQMYNNPHSCPQELLLFFHYLQYRHVLPSGKTLIQHIYDSHFSGASQVEEYIQIWQTLKPKIDEDIFDEVLMRLQKQLVNAQEWRDQINTYFYRKSRIKDCRKRTIYP
ncbi:MAG: Alpha-glucuronidase [Proteobacteria bacterium]|nr:Alpha-glucuronidase [Pseudomonadota bacterium]